MKTRPLVELGEWEGGIWIPPKGHGYLILYHHNELIQINEILVFSIHIITLSSLYY